MKFTHDGKGKLKISVAFAKVIEEYIIPFNDNHQYSTHQFRENVLWTIEVSDLLEAN